MTNVILITADALRYDHISAVGEIDETTPHLDSLCEKGLLFENVVATGSGTSSSFPGILASVLPMEYGYRGLNEDHVPIAKHFQENEIATTGITAHTHTTTVYDYDRGFDTFYQDPSINSKDSVKERIHEFVRNIPIARTIGRTALRSVRSTHRNISGINAPYKTAKEITEKSVSIIESDLDSKPMSSHFTWIHYMEPHSPPYPPESYIEHFHDGRYNLTDVYELWKYWRQNRPPVVWDDSNSVESQSLFNNQEVRAIKDYYRAQIRHLDEQIHQLIKSLKEMGVLDETIIFITSDHGEEFFDHGDLGHREKLYDELIHVPLIAYHGGGEFEDLSWCSDLISLLDLGPTIADLFNIESASRWQGSSFSSVLRGGSHDREYAISEVCHKGTDGYGGDVVPEEAIVSVRTNSKKCIVNKQAGTKELYNLENDPGEHQNMINTSNLDMNTTLQEIASERMDSFNHKLVGETEISENVRERLIELGYTGE